MKKKILIIENSLYVTGGFKAIVSATDRLKDVFDFYYVIPAKSEVGPALAAKGYQVFTLPFLEVSKSLSVINYLPRLYKNARAVLQIMQRHQIEILHVNDIFNMVGCMAKRLQPSVKLVYHVRLLKTSYIAPIYPFFAKKVKKYADAIICVSRAVLQDVGRPANAVVMYDVPDITEKYPLKNYQENSDLKILYLGNYLPGKGQMAGLQAFLQLQQQYPGAAITFAGAAENEGALQFKQQLIAAAAGNKNITIGDKITDVEAVMKAHDVVLNLSESESFSFVCLEAMLYGIPLIAADSGGPAEITGDGKKAVLVPVKNPEAAATALLQMAQHYSRYATQAADARVWAQHTFNAAAATSLLRACYEKLN